MLYQYNNSKYIKTYVKNSQRRFEFQVVFALFSGTTNSLFNLYNIIIFIYYQKKKK